MAFEQPSLHEGNGKPGVSAVRSAEYFVALLEIVGRPFETALERAIGEDWPGFEWVAHCGRAALRRYRAPSTRFRRWVNRRLGE
jgi:hypothetical protein